MNIKNTVPIKNTNNVIIFPIILLVIVILSTIGIYWYNYSLEKENNKIYERLANIEKNIWILNKNENIRIYNLIQKNKKILTKLEKYSQITYFINSMEYIKKQYWLNFKWFNYSNWIISTKASALFYSSASKFIEEYRKDEKEIFNIWFISKVTGSRELSFDLKLEIKNSFLINNKK